MKTKTLIIIGIIAILAVSITSISFVYNQEIKLATGLMTSDEKPEPKHIPDPICFVIDKATSGEKGGDAPSKACFPLSDFENLGCDRVILEHIYKYTNLLDGKFNGNYLRNLVGLPDGVSEEQYEKCANSIYEKRISMLENMELTEIQNNLDSLKLNIVRIEDGRVSLYPEDTCALIHLELLSENDIQRYRNDKKGLDSSNILQITSDDLNEIPNIQELIYAVHSIDFPYNKYSSAYLNGSTLVEYEFFLMNKAIKKYGDSQEDYFIKLDEDYEERFTNPAKEGFSNTFEAPLIVYNDNAYSVDGTVFWTSDEHEPRRMGVYPKDTVDEDEKFVTLTDEDMKSVPKIKEAIGNIGTIQESVTGLKGLPEDEWNQYREWFRQKSQVQLGSDSFRLIEYNDELYSVGFAIC